MVSGFFCSRLAPCFVQLQTWQSSCAILQILISFDVHFFASICNEFDLGGIFIFVAFGICGFPSFAQIPLYGHPGYLNDGLTLSESYALCFW